MTDEEELVELPGGLPIDDGQRLADAAIRPLSGREEAWLAEHPATPSALAVTHVLSACLSRVGNRPATPLLVRRLLVGDREALLLGLRRITIGERVMATSVCREC